MKTALLLVTAATSMLVFLGLALDTTGRWGAGALFGANLWATVTLARDLINRNKGDSSE